MFYIYSGLRGSGKSYAATRLALEYLKKGRKVWTNYPLDLSGFQGRVPVNKCFFAGSVGDLVDMRGEDFDPKKGYQKPGLFIYDESISELFSRDWKNLDKASLECFRQSRKIGMDIVLISQHFDDLDTTIRRISEFVREFHRIGFVHFWMDYVPRQIDSAKRKNVGFGWCIRQKSIAYAYDSWQLFGSLIGYRPERVWQRNGLPEQK